MLFRSHQVQRKAAKVGFDWPEEQGVMEKIREELGEVEAELSMRQTVLLEGYEMGLIEGRAHLANLSGVHGLDRENCHFCV